MPNKYRQHPTTGGIAPAVVGVAALGKKVKRKAPRTREESAAETKRLLKMGKVR